jgi:uncharacterized protein
MNPLFFGNSEQPLFGVYHPPRTQDTRPEGVVLCYPVGQEYMRAHRAFRQLAMLLAKAGFPVIRFDYFGTGDSSGAADEGTFDRWTNDIETAVDEIKDTAGVSRVSLIGLRIGATLAARVQASRDDVVRAVLWDPVVDGSQYWPQLVATTENPDAIANSADGVVGLNGFPWTTALRSAIANLNAETYPLNTRTRVALLVSREDDDYQLLRQRYSGLNGRFTYRNIPSPGDWAFVDAYGSALLPQDIIQGIVTYISEQCR